LPEVHPQLFWRLPAGPDITPTARNKDQKKKKKKQKTKKTQKTKEETETKQQKVECLVDHMLTLQTS